MPEPDFGTGVLHNDARGAGRPLEALHIVAGGRSSEVLHTLSSGASSHDSVLHSVARNLFKAPGGVEGTRQP